MNSHVTYSWKNILELSNGQRMEIHSKRDHDVARVSDENECECVTDVHFDLYLPWRLNVDNNAGSGITGIAVWSMMHKLI